MTRFAFLLAVLIATWGQAALAEPLPVRVVTAVLAPITGQAVLTGTLQAIDQVPIGFSQGGRIISVSVREGDRVSLGQELARLDPTQADAALRAAMATLGGADAALREAQQSSDRAQELLSRGAGTRADLDTATKSLLTAQSSRDQAEAQVAKARTAQDNTVLRAPKAGIVTSRDAEQGQIVNPGQKAVTMAADGGLEAAFNAPDGVDLEAFLDLPVQLTPVDQPDVTLTAHISEVSPLVDQATGSVKVKALIDGTVPDGVVFGTPVIGRLSLPQLPAITLPWTALTSLSGAPAIWTVDPATQRVQQVPVTIATYGADTIRLAAGISPGELVVTDGSQLLYPGRVVAPIKETP